MPTFPVTSALSVALLALTGCTADASTTEKSAVPAGVVAQYDALAAEVAERGGSLERGDWTVNYIVEAAEPWFEQHDSGSSYRAPEPAETHHIEIIPTETATGRIVPDVPITLEIIDAAGGVVQKQELDFFHSTFFHYAANFSVPEPGTYTLRATVGIPGFNRHGEEADGAPLIEGTTVEFTGVELAAE